MDSFTEYDRLKVSAADRLCTPDQGRALVAAKNDANCGNVVVQINVVINKYKQAAKNAMTINTASYGMNCANGKNTDVTTKVAGSCNGKEKCPYTVSAGVLGDTAGGCAKTFTADYTCPGKPKRTLNLAAEANNKIAEFDCSK